jgi:hypothetical protein
MAGRWL